MALVTKLKTLVLLQAVVCSATPEVLLSGPMSIPKIGEGVRQQLQSICRTLSPFHIFFAERPLQYVSVQLLECFDVFQRGSPKVVKLCLSTQTIYSLRQIGWEPVFGLPNVVQDTRTSSV